MSLFKPSLLIVLCCVSACGRQIVEFGADAGVGAGSDSGGGTDGSNSLDPAPTVTFESPVPGAIEIARSTVVSAAFSEPTTAATITSGAFTLAQGANAVPGAVTFDTSTNTATFTPAATLGMDLVFTATITTAVQATNGRALATNYSWRFTTGANIAPRAPIVIVTAPSDLGTNVSINEHPTATFNEAMNPLTITGATFLLHQGAASVAGAVTYDAATNTATFAPAAPLELGKVYTATITTAATADDTVPLAATYMWTFTTAMCSQSAVVLGGATNFAVLAGTTVTSTGATMVTGDLGIDPGTAVTGFPPAVLVGTMHLADATASMGVADLSTAFTTTANLTNCSVGIIGELGGMTLAPGLYKSTSGLMISTTLTLDAQGDDNAVFIFDMATTLGTSSGAQVVLTNGANAANVFWQVGSSASLGSTTAFAGTIMAGTAISMDDGVTLDGRALAIGAAVTMIRDTIVKP